MQTFLILLAVHSLLLYIVLKKRFWVIEKLAGGRPVVLNVTMKGGSFILKAKDEGYFANSTFEGPIAGKALFEIEL